MSVASKVSRRLSETIAPEVLKHIYRPRLAGEMLITFPWYDALNAAHCVMLAKQGILTPEQAKAIAGGLLRIAEEGAGAITPDPALEDAYFNIEARLVELIGPDAGGRLHIARSRNDLSAALDRLRAREAVLDLLEASAKVRHTFIERGAEFADVVMPGYTHLQPAQPITFGFYLTGLASALERDAERLLDLWKRLNLSPMGAAALATTTFPIDRAMVAALLGFDGVLEHGLDCVASRDFSVELIAGAAQMSLTLSRFAEDMHVFVTHEFSSVEFPDSVCGTSSIMPQKKNPVVLEHLKAKAAHVVAGFSSAGAIIRGSHFTNTLDAHREGQALIWPGLAEAQRALALAGIAAATVQPKRELLLERARANFSTATDLADALVRFANMDFRTAHHVAGAVVRKLMDAGLQAHEADLAFVELASLEVARRPSGLSAAQVAEALDPVRSVAARTIPGGTAPGEVRRMAERMAVRLEGDEALVASWRAQLHQASIRRATALQEFAAA
ncbi:MAG: argininosuccinate lyase [Rubritepida sp.]|nr:argininosuccinate lyase [Rubritepida sp.]